MRLVEGFVCVGRHGESGIDAYYSPATTVVPRNSLTFHYFCALKIA